MLATASDLKSWHKVYIKKENYEWQWYNWDNHFLMTANDSILGEERRSELEFFFNLFLLLKKGQKISVFM